MDVAGYDVTFWDLGGQVLLAVSFQAKTSFLPQSAHKHAKLCCCHFSLSSVSPSYIGWPPQATMRAIWRQYVPDAHAILYVVDAAEPGRFAAARAELGTATPAITQQCSSTHARCYGATLLPGHLPRQTIGCSRRAQYTCASVCQQTRLGCTS